MSKDRRKVPMRKGNNLSIKSAIAAVILLVFAGCVDQLRQIEQHEDVSKPYTEEILEISENTIETDKISLDFTTCNGFMEIHLWEKESYKIEVNKWAKGETSEEAKTLAETLQVTLSEEIKGQTTTIRVKAEFKKDTGTDITAYLPRKAFDIVELSSINGYLETEEITASYVSLETVNGSIEAHVTADSIRVRTVNGGIKGFFQGDDIDISTVNGDIAIQAGSVGVFDISTVNGDIDMTVDSDFTFDLEISHGKISVRADGVTYTLDTKTHKKGSTAEDANVSVKASTANGSIAVAKT